MPLSSSDQQGVSRETRTARNRGAAVRRAANRQRVSGAIVLTATDSAGLRYVLVMVPAKEPGKAYLVTREKKSGQWICGCFRARWQHGCDHLEAVRLLPEAAHEHGGSRSPDREHA